MATAETVRAVRCVVFDFDGVLVDSNAGKREAFFSIFPEAFRDRGYVDAALANCAEGDRYDVIRDVLRLSRAGQSDVDDNVDTLLASYAEHYSEICEQLTVSCREVPGATAALEKLATDFPLYINSATPQEPLRKVIALRGWQRYFQGVLGRPASKVENFKSIFAAESMEAGECVFVGDHQSDLDAARAVGCAFVGVRDASSDFTQLPELMVDDLAALPPVIASLAGLPEVIGERRAGAL